MRLFGKVDGQIDRFDRAGWITIPFDLALAPPIGGPPNQVGVFASCSPSVSCMIDVGPSVPVCARAIPGVRVKVLTGIS